MVCSLHESDSQQSAVPSQAHIQLDIPFAPCPQGSHIPPTAGGPSTSPVIDDLALAATVAVVVQDDVAVPAIELPIRSGVHGHFVGAFNSPDLAEQSWTQHGVHPLPQFSPATVTLPGTSF